MLRNLPYGLLLVWTLLFGASCASSYQRQWKQAVQAQAAAATQDFQGAWEGTWHSESTGHRGKLRCLITPHAEQPGHYDFRYWAQWALLSGTFPATYPVTKDGEAWIFAGESDLGWLGGVYRHRGQATTQRFHANYDSTKGDRGTFTMTRP